MKIFLTILAIVLSYIITVFADLSYEKELLIYIMFINLIFSPKLPTLKNSFESVFKVKLNVGFPVMMNILSSVVLLTIIIIEIQYECSLELITLGYVLSGLPGFILIVLKSKEIIKPIFSIDLRIWRYFLKESFPLAFYGLLINLSNRIDVLKQEKDKIKSNREAYIAELKKKEASQKKLLELFTALSKSKPKIPFVIPSTSISFASLKGNMEWPAKGTISSRFGMNYNSELKTWKNNLGIDISAERGSEVYCVSYGRVYDSLWLPGFGPILIIEHDNGYITSYAHLMEILVELGDIVYQGQVIARVGDVGSFEGPKLNFQIWKDGKNLSPEVWLKRRTISAVVK